MLILTLFTYHQPLDIKKNSRVASLINYLKGPEGAVVTTERPATITRFIAYIATGSMYLPMEDLSK